MSDTDIYSYGQSFGDLGWSLIVSFLTLIILSPLYRSKKSFFDHLAARRVIGVIRVFVILELVLNCILLYVTLYKGEPIHLHAITDYGNGSSWIYGFGRPVTGIVLITIGVIGDMHFIARILCLMALLLELATDAISAVQIQDLIFQIEHYSVATSNYSMYWLQVYYWRDLISFGICFFLVVLTAHFTSIVGWCDPPLFHYRMVTGGHADRVQVMRDHREHRMEGVMNIVRNIRMGTKLKSKKIFNRAAEDMAQDRDEEEQLVDGDAV